MFDAHPFDPSDPWFSAIAVLAALVAVLTLRHAWRTLHAFLRREEPAPFEMCPLQGSPRVSSASGEPRLQTAHTPLTRTISLTVPRARELTPDERNAS
jgi:hypothetical protein